MQHMPTDSAERKGIPMAEGLLYYFPAALAEVAMVSKAGNDKHNPGQPMHHARGKSNDHADCIIRHLIDAGTVDPDDGMRHSAKVAWRALALLQEELEREGAPLARNAKLPDVPALPIPVTIAEAVQDVKEIIGVGLTSSDDEDVPPVDPHADFRFRVKSHSTPGTFTAKWVNGQWEVRRLGESWKAPGIWSDKSVQANLADGFWIRVDPDLSED